MRMEQHFRLIQVFQERVQHVLVLFVQINYLRKYYVHATNQFHLMVQLFVVSKFELIESDYSKM